MAKIIAMVWVKGDRIKHRSLDGISGSRNVEGLTASQVQDEMKRYKRNLEAHGFVVVPKDLFHQIKKARAL